MVHIKALEQALKHGLKLKKLYRVIEFRQSKWMNAYIMLNTRLRKDAYNEFEKDFFKLMNNSVFGKTMENLRNRIDVKLINNEKEYLKCTSKPSYMSHKIFDKNSVGIRKNKLELKLNKPAYIGMRVLELSKSINV